MIFICIIKNKRTLLYQWLARSLTLKQRLEATKKWPKIQRAIKTSNYILSYFNFF